MLIISYQSGYPALLGIFTVSSVSMSLYFYVSIYLCISVCLLYLLYLSMFPKPNLTLNMATCLLTYLPTSLSHPSLSLSSLPLSLIPPSLSHPSLSLSHPSLSLSSLPLSLIPPSLSLIPPSLSHPSHSLSHSSLSLSSLPLSLIPTSLSHPSLSLSSLPLSLIPPSLFPDKKFPVNEALLLYPTWYNLEQWKPLNVITVNVISRLL